LGALQGFGESTRVTVGARSLSFEELFDAHRTSTLAVVLALRGPGADAEDVVQEAFARALVRWDHVGAMARPDLWVQRVARLAGRPETATSAFALEQPFWDAVRRLPAKQARVVALRYAGDLTVADIAAIVGTAEGTVKAQLHAARHRLAVLLHEPRQEAGP
jgi:RNA polymerase sigma-70 factor, ECF subfamily